MTEPNQGKMSGPQNLHNSEAKLPAIPTGARIQKRPLTRRQIPASSKSPIIYVSSNTPFMSAVKRTRKLLDKALKNTAAAPKNASLHARIEALKQNANGVGGQTVVTVMGTGKAIAKTVAVASWFEQQGDCIVKMKTRTVATVDDVVVVEDEEEDGGFGVENESRVRKLSCLEVTVSLK